MTTKIKDDAVRTPGGRLVTAKFVLANARPALLPRMTPDGLSDMLWSADRFGLTDAAASIRGEMMRRHS